MSGLFLTLRTSESGMRVHQKAIQTTSNNVANINTPGYSRQRAEIVSSGALYNPSRTNITNNGQMGTGAGISAITRARNAFYDHQYRSEVHNYGETNVKYDYYNGIESIIKEPSDYGISSKLKDFFSGWEELSKNTSSKSSKNLVVEKGLDLANALSDAYNKLNNLKEGISGNIDTEIEQINGMLDSLKEIERQIDLVNASGSDPNTLLDEKDRILDELSSKLDIQDKDVATMIADGKLDRAELEEAFNNGVKVSGSLQGYHDMDGKLNEYMEDLQTLSDTIVDQVNNAYGGTFFEKGNPPADKLIKVEETIKNNPYLIDITSEQAEAVGNVQNQKFNMNGEKTTINKYYNNYAERIGIDSSKVVQDEKNQRGLLTEIDNFRMSISGVSLDEEFVNLIQLNHSYTASAKVLSTVDQLLDVVINGIIR
ncbi:flagellar hook-associated protein FlgK [Metaclostridioides mangenotii]|uniref:Flagellar hook-associated protein 1 n=1 Tax=Metaclostridioides mangenotii TaxID=1540 RepID=A0ABS4ECK5_9FIRM|nr:flagellar hook-associated protein FlgK [Clostridioides mangenotii]MBP1855665.1 flagellar hook-associated protein 1 FlgK [Clostridioides mangenotii]